MYTHFLFKLWIKLSLQLKRIEKVYFVSSPKPLHKVRSSCPSDNKIFLVEDSFDLILKTNYKQKFTNWITTTDLIFILFLKSSVYEQAA